MPTEDDYIRFVEKVDDCKRRCCLDVFARNRKSFQIKKEKTIAKNLQRIFDAALKISNKKGFNAMSMREVSVEAGLSIGALYNYFGGKEELLCMIQAQHRSVTDRILRSEIAAETAPNLKLAAAIRAHLYLSEAMQPWFYFSYMEARHFGPEERRAAVQGELDTDGLFADILEAGRRQGVFCIDNCHMAAGLIKAMLQDWYVKHSKYARRRISADQYLQFLTDFLSKSLRCN